MFFPLCCRTCAKLSQLPLNIFPRSRVSVLLHRLRLSFFHAFWIYFHVLIFSSIFSTFSPHQEWHYLAQSTCCRIPCVFWHSVNCAGFFCWRLPNVFTGSSRPPPHVFYIIVNLLVVVYPHFVVCLICVPMFHSRPLHVFYSILVLLHSLFVSYFEYLHV